MQSAIFIFPATRLVELIEQHIPPWVDGHRELAETIIRYLLANEHCLVVDLSDEEKQVAWNYSEIITDNRVLAELYELVNGPFHPSLFPLFHSPIKKVHLGLRTLTIRYELDVTE